MRSSLLDVLRVVALIPAAACAPEQAPAPPSLDQFIHDAWRMYAEEDLAGIAAEAAVVSETFDQAEFPLAGTFSDMTADEFGLVELEWDADPTDATGFYVVDDMDCSSAETQVALTKLEQMEVYPDNYTAYEREYTTDDAAFFADESDILYWDTTYTVAIPIIGNYTMSIHGGAQRLDGQWDSPGFSTRTWAPNPAVTDPEDLHFEQDYQIEVFFPGGEGMIHVYGMWRQFGLNADSTQDDELIRNTILSAMEDYFDNTAEFCATLR
jgi:hypothetical protein